MGDENTVSNNEVDARQRFAQMKQGENMTSNERLKGKQSTSSSDLRSTALDCHAKISKELWGKREAASSIALLPVGETEAYALDTAIRIFWSLLRNEDELNQCSLSPQVTKKLRIIALETLNKYKEQLTKEYSFLIPDPAEIKQREDDKQKLLSNANNARKQRMELAKKEREERQRRMKEKSLQTSASEADVRSLVSKADEGKGGDQKAATLSVPPKRTFPLIKGQSFAGGITRPSPTPSSEQTAAPTAATLGGEMKKKISVPVIIKPPSTPIKVVATNSNPPSTERKKELPVISTAPRKSLGALEKFQQQSSGSKQQKTFVVPSSVKRRDNSAASAASKESANIPSSNSNESSGNTSSDNNDKEQNQQQNTSTNENTNEKGQNQEEEPVPMITVKQLLLDTEQLNKYLQERVIDEFIQIIKNQKSGNEKNNFDFYHFTVKGPRPANEDEFTVIENLNEYLDLPESNGKYSFIGVYDGHSGKYTSLYTRSQLHFKASNRPEFFSDPEKAIYESILQVDELVNDIQTKNQFACGTTALSCWIKNKEEIYVANVGDCRGFICRNSEAMEIAKPHHPDLPEEKARIVNNGGAVVWQGTWRVNGVLAVSRSIGDVNMKRWVIPNPDITKFTIQPTDEFMILASDGLWDVIKPNEMIDIVRSTVKTLGRKYVCKQLCESALQKNSKDNVTAIVIFFTSESDN